MYVKKLMLIKVLYIEELTKICLVENERKTNILVRYGEYYGNLILQGKIVIGMTKQQCIDAIGNPTRINRTTTAVTIYEQWVYSGRYLYFENGKLVTIQD